MHEIKLMRIILLVWYTLLLWNSQVSAFFNSRGGGTDATDMVLTKAQHEAFERDGYLVLRGLFGEEDIDSMTKAGDLLVEISQQNKFETFSVVETNLIYGLLDMKISSNDTDNDTNECREEEKKQMETIVQIFRGIALRSKLAQICAELMKLDPSTQRARLLRDVFLAKDVVASSTCDWHVDDQGFWPESFLSSVSPDGQVQEGINVWIALDEYKPEYGGAMIVARGSHKAPWAHEAHLAIGQDRTVDGGKTQEQILQAFTDPTFNGTCALDISSPEIRAKAEALRVDIPLKKGDCILSTRSLFHRTASVTEAGMAFYESIGKQLLHRYSLRYSPGSARLPQGFVSDASCKYDPSHAGKSLDEICSSPQSPAWYPQVWPEVEQDIDARLDELAQNQFPIARAQQDRDRTILLARMKEMQQGKEKKT